MTEFKTGRFERAWSALERPSGADPSSVVFPGQGYIRGFDGMRALAVMLVIQGHLGYTQGYYSAFRGVNDGVAIFFVMSGFLITGLLLREESLGGIRLGRFYVRRFLRLYPALLVFLLGVWVAEHLGIASVTPMAYVLALAYLSNYGTREHGARETVHLWSLAVEEQFYLTWPLVMKYARRFVIPVAVLGLGVCTWFRLHPLDHPDRFVDRWFVPAVDSILLGCLAALVVIPRFETSQWLRRFVSSPECLLLAALCYLAPKWSVVPSVGAANSAIILLQVQRFGVVLGLIWLCTNQRSLLVRLLELRPIAYIGRISYGVYLWQGLFVRNGPAGATSWVHEFPANVILSVAAAAVSFELVEQRVGRLKARFSSAR